MAEATTRVPRPAVRSGERQRHAGAARQGGRTSPMQGDPRPGEEREAGHGEQRTDPTGDGYGHRRQRRQAMQEPAERECRRVQERRKGEQPRKRLEWRRHRATISFGVPLASDPPCRGPAVLRSIQALHFSCGALAFFSS
jgi:hypothetical protein